LPHTIPLEELRLNLIRELGMARCLATSIKVIEELLMDDGVPRLDGHTDATGVIEWESAVRLDGNTIATQRWRTTIIHEEIRPRSVRRV